MSALRGLAVWGAGFVLALAAGCSDKPVMYKQGQYQGKPDSKPWENAQYNGNQGEWEKAIKTRNQGQDEYTRSVASAK